MLTLASCDPQANCYLFTPAARPSPGDAQRTVDPSSLLSLLKGFSCISLFRTSICAEFSLSSALSPEKALFQFFFTFFTTFTSFIFHLYLIHLMFYSHPSRLEFILFAVLSTHFLLHQYFISSFPLFFFTCCSPLFFPRLFSPLSAMFL